MTIHFFFLVFMLRRASDEPRGHAAAIMNEVLLDADCKGVINGFVLQFCVLGNLCPETAEEAVAMVPSLKTKGRAHSDEAIEKMLSRSKDYKHISGCNIHLSSC
ncbi:Uncharacterized protein Rs2_12257 [Raphanus sativus]|uniref:Uncharacterized protein LOC108847707 n=1 Tax=Raphanus sativus TaxID=3726 RepID=A0A6J0MXZ1_RAPSA|nr:uncharacterized protein LOC108847707 [Raphanus sativus]XP_018476531.1 uncharacterized protein LOC108847707 [Raphanus sativus]XP_056861442.1 uncharacterized protein LOC130494245 [Raphanus sativus]XP_056861443.1 uncharacterized protein LOC130494245 [Raphanus sativus]KAJ4866542.1 Uncharacterized protein Rs2_51935 [Raphanus sativus]KAJ4908599.1 Uncharacterized protein Rs2_12257 [Raphanus sativus]